MNAVAERPSLSDPWARWEAALRGEPLDLGARGDPPWGYFRFPPSKTAGPNARQEAVAIWRDDEGELQCVRNVYGDGSKMTALQIDEMFSAEHYAIPFELYMAVTDRNEPWPEIYTTRLRTKDIVNGIVWTEEWARKQLAAKVETHDEAGNPRAVIGDNGAPADATPDQALAARILNIGKQLAAWLATIGGKPTTQAEADTLGNYANTFKDFENEAVAAHKGEKQPFLDGGRDVDARWFAPVRDKAIAARAKALALAKEFTDAENARRIEAARVVNEANRKAAAAVAKTADAPSAPIAEVVPERAKVATLRGGGPKSTPVWTVTDLPKFVAYCAGLEIPPPDLVDACEKIARKFGPAGVRAPGLSFKERT
jgi:hypothetical protein